MGKEGSEAAGSSEEGQTEPGLWVMGRRSDFKCDTNPVPVLGSLSCLMNNNRRPY